MKSGQPYYTAMAFTYIDHWSLELVDETYAERMTMCLTRGARLPTAAELFKVKIDMPGKPMDVSFASISVPVVSERAATLFHNIAKDDIQLFPATIESTNAAYYVMNISSCLDCLDWERSKTVAVQGPGGGHINAPQYIISPARVGNSHIFRLQNDPFVIVIDQMLKDAIVEFGLIGPGMISLDYKAVEIMPGFDPPKPRRRSARGKHADR